MALTAMQIYKSLPRTNCKDCGLPTCMAFAMQVAAKRKALAECPHISAEAQTDLSEASAPPMKLITIGAGDKTFEFGQETVMFRHEEKFMRPCGIAVKIPASANDDEANAKVGQINNSVFTRVGEKLKVSLCAVCLDGVSNPAARAALIAGKSNVPLILMSESPGTMKTALDAVKQVKPLIYKANSTTVEDFAALAAGAGVPLAISGSSVEELAELTVKAKNKGAANLVLAFDTDKPGETIRSLTIARRAAIKKNFRALGYPTVVEMKGETPESETVIGAMFAAKYAGILMIDYCEPWELLPVMTTIQDIFTDPQVPNTVEAKLYEIGSPGDSSPVMFTTNFSLTYFSVAGEVERSRIPAYISVVDTEGLGVLNAYAGDKISVEKVVKTIASQKIAEKVKHRKLIIPGLLPIFRAEIEDTSEWKEVIIGPETAREIPAFLAKVWK
ncbi:MAG: acetyl-CoA decarbonylase/synthase complex subunit gamma [Spirochaetales bacterium]|nr:acetyl-CoA decarbonylase/synthase complex subunit gamma [Spirochaetales bacterium]